MKKLLIFFITIALIPIINVNAQTVVNVSNQEQLKEALNNEEVTDIKLNNDIETTEKINITRSVNIDGNNHTIKYVGTFGSDRSSDNTIWSGIYILQVYKTSATIKNIKLTGGNAALLVNGSNVRLEGKIDVSGNGFGGIELSQGKNVTSTVKVTLSDDINIINTTETSNKPTMWVPEDSDDATIIMNGIAKTIKSGEELTITEIEQLFEDVPQENPKTSDNITLNIILSIIGLINFIIIYKYLSKENIREL